MCVSWLAKGQKLGTGTYLPSGSYSSAQQLLASSPSLYAYICTLSESQVSEAQTKHQSY